MVAAVSAARRNIVFIRKSGSQQDDEAQKANVRNMLAALGVSVPDDDWFVCTVKRSKVKGNADFQRLFSEIEANRISTVFIESQDRFGTGYVAELFSFLAKLAEHKTGLFDLRDGVDLTGRDDATEMRAFLNGLKSKKERKDLSYRSLRTRLNNFKERGSWPTGTHPFGFGKRCTAPDGRLLWEWQPVSRTIGQVFFPDDKGVLQPGPCGVRLPRKTRDDRIVLIPSNNQEHVATIRLIFDLFVRVGLSRRQISARLNGEGRQFYDRPFMHTLVNMILKNPAYVGDTHLGKQQSAEFYTFNKSGTVVEVDDEFAKKERDESERIIKRDTHEGLIDRKTWNATQKKFEREGERKSYPALNPAYYLKPLLVCGHCGKNMTGRTEIDPTSKERRVVYFCSSYIVGRASGSKVQCGAHRITHEDAEKLLFDKITEKQLTFDVEASTAARKQILGQYDALEAADEKARRKWLEWLEEGVAALIEYLKDAYHFTSKELDTLRVRARDFYKVGRLSKTQMSTLPIKWSEFRGAVEAAEASGLAVAKGKVEELTQTLNKYVKAWAIAEGMQLAILKEEAARLEVEISMWRERSRTVRERLSEIYAADEVRQAAREKLLAEWPTLGDCEKAEALATLFRTVTLFWTSEFKPSEAKPSRPRKTERKGRWAYTLDANRIEWVFGVPKSDLSV